MLGFLLKLLLKSKKFGKKYIIKPLKSGKKWFINPVKSFKDNLKKRFNIIEQIKYKTYPVKKTGKKIADNVKKTGYSINDKFSGGKRTDIIIEIMEKSRIIELTKHSADYALSDSNARIEVEQFIKDINFNSDLLKLKSTTELEELKKMLDKELENLGYDPSDTQNVNEKEIYDKSLSIAYEEHMSEWEYNFLNSDVEDQAGEIYDDETKREIFSKILEDYTFEKFIEAKGLV